MINTKTISASKMLDWCSAANENLLKILQVGMYAVVVQKHYYIESFK